MTSTHGGNKAEKRGKSGYPPAPWHVVYYQRPKSIDEAETVPARVFLRDGCPAGIRAELLAVAKAVADSPPPAFAGGGKWEAMTGDMAGIYQVKANGFDAGGRWHWRLFAVLERRNDVAGLPGASVVLIAGMRKPYLTVFDDGDYAEVAALAREFSSTTPRRIAP